MAKLRIVVEFYNHKEQDLIRANYPAEYQLLENLTKTGQLVSYEDFKVYSQFHHQNSERPKLKDFESISKLVDDLFGTVKTYTNYDPELERLTSEYEDNNEQTAVSESLGVGGILTILGAAYGLTNADWKRINISGHKDFDFDSSVIDGFDKMLVVEAKGSIVPDNTGPKHSRIRDHRVSIKKKKNDKKFKADYQHGTDLLLGAITAVDPKNNVKVYLLDPPEDSYLTPEFRRKIKLLKRLNYYYDYIFWISKTSSLSLLLHERIKNLSKIPDIDNLDNMPLTSASGKIMRTTDSFINTHCHIGRRIIGTIIPVSDFTAVFIGLPIEILNMLGKQNFETILKYKASPNSYYETLECNISKRRLKGSSFFNTISDKLNEEAGRGSYYRFYINNLQFTKSSSGFTFSVIKRSDLAN